MKFEVFLVLVLVLGPIGCAHTARRVSPPSHAAMVAAGQREAVAVKSASATAATARRAVHSAQVSAGRAEGLRQSASSKLATLRQVAPAELHPQIDAVALDLSNGQAVQVNLSLELSAAESAQALTDGHLQEAQSAQAEHEKMTAAYIASTAKIVEKLNTVSEQWAEDRTKLSWYRWHWWGSWIALGAGVLACLVFAFLKFTGRLALTSAALAAKFP